MSAPRIRLVLFVLALVLLAGLAAAPQVSAQFPGRPGRIAFLASFHGQNRDDIYSIRTDGTGLQRLTMAPTARKSGPSWSPAGTLIAFHVVSLDGTWVYVMNPDGTGRMRITEGSNPTWGPDGDLLFESPVSCRQGARLATATLAGNVDDLPICGTQPAWSPDGGTIAFTRGRDPIDGGGFANRDIWIAALDGSDLRRVARSAGTEDAPRALLDPSWSPDGRLLAFEDVRSQPGCSAPISFVRYVNPATGAKGKGPEQHLGFDWSPAGGAFVTASIGSKDPCAFEPISSTLAITPQDGGAATTVLSIPFDEEAPNLMGEPSWQPRRRT